MSSESSSVVGATLNFYLWDREKREATTKPVTCDGYNCTTYQVGAG
jgi:hypothetical protein